MKLIMGGINGHYLRNITKNSARATERVLAAVAYATDASLLFDWCLQHKIPLEFYGRLDDGVAVKVPILETFLNTKSPDFVCRLVQHHHAKVIWWRGFGAYIGSANLTRSAWRKNVEAGCFFPEAEINDEMARDLRDLFDTLEKHATQLSEELLKEMEKRAGELSTSARDSKGFWENPNFKKWDGLVHQAAVELSDTRAMQLEYWTAFHEVLNKVGGKVSGTNRTPQPQLVMGYPIGRSGFNLQAKMFRMERRVRSELYISKDNAKALFHLLQEQKDAIEAELDYPLKWDELPHRRRSRIVIYLDDADPEEKKDWPRQHKWLAEHLNDLHRVFVDRVEKLRAVDWQAAENTDGL